MKSKSMVSIAAVVIATSLTACSEQPTSEAEQEQSRLGEALEKVQDKTQVVTEAVKSTGGTLSSDVKAQGSALMDKAKTTTGEAMSNVKSMATSAVNEAKAAGSSAMDEAKQMTTDKIDEVKKKLNEGVNSARQTVIAAPLTSDLASASSAMPDGAALAASKGCIACHSTGDAKMIGPAWGGLAGSMRQFTDGSKAIADDDYLRAAIMEPNAKIVDGFAATMPAMPLQEQEVVALVDYIKTLN